MKKIFKAWIKIIRNPKEIFRTEMQNATLGNATTKIVIAVVIMWIPWIILEIIFEIFRTSKTSSDLGMLIFMILLSIFCSTIGLMIVSGICYLIAKLLDGKGNYTTQTYLIALFSVPLSILFAIGTFLSYTLIPLLFYLFIPQSFIVQSAATISSLVVLIIICLYTFYLLTVALKETHQYRTNEAVLTWLIPLAIIGIILIGWHLNISERVPWE